MRSLKSVVLVACAMISVQAMCSQGAEVQEGVRHRLQADGQAPVLVTLRAERLAKTGEGRFKAIAELQESVLSALTEEDFEVRYRYKTIPAFSGTLYESGFYKLRAHPDVAAITLDEAGSGSLQQSVPAIGADVVHGSGLTGKGVVIGVLDSGIDTGHPDLADAVVHQHHFLNRGDDVGPGAEDGHGHGTNVTGIVTANGAVVGPGVAPDAQIVAIQVLDSQNRGWVSDWVAGVDHIVSGNDSLGVQVINMSLVTDALYSTADCDAQQPAFAAAVQAARDQGIVIFASSGNKGSTTSMGAPACLSASVAVGAVYDSDLGREPNSGTYQTQFGGSWPACADDPATLTTVTCFTNRTGKLALVAPGARITSTGLGSGISTFTGTSQASPHVAGVAALMLEKQPTLSAAEIVAIMQESPTMVHDSDTGLEFPLLNATDALERVTQVDEPGDPLPATFTLEQNFPNPVRKSGPFPEQTTIRYILSTPAEVTISLFDVLGRELRRIHRGMQSQGEHEMRLRLEDLPSGLYFYKLQVGSVSAMRKMVVLH